jgi:hypothetical protein
VIGCVNLAPYVIYFVDEFSLPLSSVSVIVLIMDSKRKSSVIWNFFTVQNEIKASCNFCQQHLSYKSSITNLKQHIERKHPGIKLLRSTSQSCSGSGNSRNIEAEAEDPVPATTQEDVQPTQRPGNTPIPCSSTDKTITVATVPSTSNLKPKLQQRQDTITFQKKLNLNKKKYIDDKLLQMITSDFQPFSIIEDMGFQAYSKALNPSYTLPSRKFVSQTLLPAKLLKIHTKSKNLI